jgi:hypothetical protein
MNSVPLWVTLLGFAAPLITLAGSAVAFVVKLYLDAGERLRNHFFDLMDKIDGQSSIAKKVAAFYALRQFPEHRDFIIRFCKTQRSNVSGPGTASAALIAEMEATQLSSKRKFQTETLPLRHYRVVTVCKSLKQELFTGL